MQIITRRTHERILIDHELTVTVVEINEGEVTLEIAGRDGETERVTLNCNDVPWNDAPFAGETPQSEHELVLT